MTAVVKAPGTSESPGLVKRSVEQSRVLLQLYLSFRSELASKHVPQRTLHILCYHLGS